MACLGGVKHPLSHPPPFGVCMDLLRALQVASETRTASATAVLRRCGRCRPRGFTYPFGSPVSIERSHLPMFRSKEFYVADKADGVRVCLVLTQTITGPLSVLIDRRGVAYEVPVTCDSAYFRDTVFDCELVRLFKTQGTATHMLAVFDAAIIAGDTDVGRQHLSVRLQEIEGTFPRMDAGLLENPAFVVSNLPALVMVAKPMQKLDGLVQPSGSRPYDTDGFILTPENDPAPPPGIAMDVLKVKTSHTLDLLWVTNDLYLGSLDHLVSVTTLSSDQDVAIVVDTDSFRSAPPSSVVEVTPVVDVDEEGEGEGDGDGDNDDPDSPPKRRRITLRFVKVRDDRSVPNHMRCVVSTLRSVLDCVGMVDVIASINLCA